VAVTVSSRALEDSKFAGTDLPPSTFLFFSMASNEDVEEQRRCSDLIEEVNPVTWCSVLFVGRSKSRVGFTCR
jgi:hypothetical protein